MSNKDIKPVSRKTDIVVQDYAHEVLIYDLLEDKAFSLNETSAFIWQLCDGSNSISDIAENSSKKFNVSISDEFVWLALEQLKKDNLLENPGDFSADFGGLSRREVIRKIGFATLVALPLVSSLIAPTAAHAASGSAATCSGSCQCPNATVVFCTPAGGGGTTVCNNLAPTANCRCRGPFGTDGSGTSPGQKTGNCAGVTNFTITISNGENVVIQQ